MQHKGEIFRCETEQEAVTWMEQQAEREMRLCVCPSTQDYNYDISTDGILYTCHYCHTLKRYEAYKMEQRTSNINDGKQNKELGIRYKITSHKRDKIVFAARLVYCTYVLGYWDEDFVIMYKDGNPNNINPDNIAERTNYTLTDEHAEMMNNLLPIYSRNFIRIQNYVQYLRRITIDDAKDCTEEAFLILLARITKNEMEMFLPAWINMAAKMSRKYVELRMKTCDLDAIEFKVHDRAYEINLLDILEDEQQREVMKLIAQGYSQSQAGEILNMTKRQIGVRQRKASAILRDYLKTDKEIMKIYAKDTHNWAGSAKDFCTR